MKKKILIPSAILLALTIGGITMAVPPNKPTKQDAQPTTTSQALPTINTIPGIANNSATTTAPVTAGTSAPADPGTPGTVSTPTPVDPPVQPAPVDVAPVDNPPAPSTTVSGDTSSVSAPVFTVTSQRPAGTNSK